MKFANTFLVLTLATLALVFGQSGFAYASPKGRALVDPPPEVGKCCDAGMGCTWFGGKTSCDPVKTCAASACS